MRTLVFVFIFMASFIQPLHAEKSQTKIRKVVEELFDISLEDMRSTNVHEHYTEVNFNNRNRVLRQYENDNDLRKVKKKLIESIKKEKISKWDTVDLCLESLSQHLHLNVEYFDSKYFRDFLKFYRKVFLNIDLIFKNARWLDLESVLGQLESVSRIELADDTGKEVQKLLKVLKKKLEAGSLIKQTSSSCFNSINE